MKLEEKVKVFNQGPNVIAIPRSLSQLLEIAAGDYLVVSLAGDELVIEKEITKFTFNLSQRVKIFKQDSNLMTIPKLMCKLLNISKGDRILLSFDFHNICIKARKINE